MAENSTARSLISKILFVVGVLVLLGLLAWAILRIVPKVVSSIAGVGSSVSGVFGNGDLDVAVSPGTVKTGKPALVSWTYAKAEGGSYSLSYPCLSGATLTLEREGASPKTMVCGTGYTLGDEPGYATVTPRLADGESLADVDLRVAYREGGKDVAEGVELLTVTDGTGYDEPDDGDETATEATVDAEPAKPVQSGSGYSIGWGQGSTGAVTGGRANLAVSNITADGGSLLFDVRNTGGSATGVWDFSYTTPTRPSDLFQGPAMMSLNPGEGLRVRVRFGEVDSGTHNVTVMVDPYNRISETSEADNSFGVTVRGSSSSSNDDDDDRGSDDANLSIYSIEIGRYDANGNFDEDDTLKEDDTVVVRFKVRNDGDEDTRTWRYEIDVPGGDDVRSSRITGLDEGDTRTFEVSLGKLDEDDYEITVEVDSDDDIDEEDEGDNEESIDFEVED